MSILKVGIQLQARCEAWEPLHATALRVDVLGYDYLFLPDHLMVQADDEHPTHFESIASTAAIAASTAAVRLGLLVGSNTFRNPALYAKTMTTIDHISGGRAVLGIGSGYYKREHTATGIELGASRQVRLGWLREALSVIRPLLHGECVTYRGEHYQTDHLVLSPRPVQQRLPILVGGSGERLTLPAVARYADMWNMEANLDTATRKIDILQQCCDAIGRDRADIECSVLAGPPLVRATEREAMAELAARLRATGSAPPTKRPPWVGTPDHVAETVRRFAAIGFTTLIFGMGAPHDDETLVRLIGEVKPRVRQTM